MNIVRFVNSVFNSNTYIVFDDEKGFIIDIGDFDPVLEFVKNHNIDIVALFITHTHYDHIYGIKEFIREFPNVPIYTSVFGKEALRKSNWNFSRYHDDLIEIDSPNIRILTNNENVYVSHMKVLTIVCPGHDKSCLAFKVKNNLFTGDSYIPNHKVIARFSNSDKHDAKFWHDKFREMSLSYTIYPGHN